MFYILLASDRILTCKSNKGTYDYTMRPCSRVLIECGVSASSNGNLNYCCYLVALLLWWYICESIQFSTCFRNVGARVFFIYASGYSSTCNFSIFVDVTNASSNGKQCASYCAQPAALYSVEAEVGYETVYDCHEHKHPGFLHS